METNPKPSPAGDNGRGPGGRFGPGNRAGRGNPMAQKVQQLRAALLKAIKPNDIRDVIETMLKSAKGGDIAAGREHQEIPYTLGRSAEWRLGGRFPSREIIVEFWP